MQVCRAFFKLTCTDDLRETVDSSSAIKRRRHEGLSPRPHELEGQILFYFITICAFSGGVDLEHFRHFLFYFTLFCSSLVLCRNWTSRNRAADSGGLAPLGCVSTAPHRHI